MATPTNRWFNIVWNNKESNSLKKGSLFDLLLDGKRLYSSEPTNPFDFKSFAETQYEPRIYVDYNQANDVIMKIFNHK